MSPDKIPDNWRTEHLLLLVGANPLPDYVAGKLLLRDGGTLHLLHSPHTHPIAKRISSRFEQCLTYEIQDPASSVEIRQVVKRAIANCTGGSVGLNYTGGTKAMAVHAYEMVTCRTLTRSLQPVVVTYLDARTLSLRRTDTATTCCVKYAVRPKIVEDVLALHAIDLAPDWPVLRDPEHAPLNESLARAHTRQSGQQAYDQWCERYLRSARGRLVENLKDFQVLPIPFPDQGELEEVAVAMRTAFGVSGDAFDPGALVADPKAGFRNVKALTKYLDGDWVEHLTLAAFIANWDSCRLHDRAMSMQTITAPYDFEFDIAALQGYQLYAVSCTRSFLRDRCKSKLFEAYVRAAQLGGDEAKVGLVCCDRDPQRLQRQVTDTWRIENERIRVFGPQEIADLPKHFRDWLSR